MIEDNTIKSETMRDMRIYQLSTRFFKLGLLIWNRIKIIGADNIPNNGGVLIASNHTSYLDPPIVGVGYRKRPVHFIARDTLWSSSFSRIHLSHSRGLAVRLTVLSGSALR